MSQKKRNNRKNSLSHMITTHTSLFLLQIGGPQLLHTLLLQILRLTQHSMLKHNVGETANDGSLILSKRCTILLNVLLTGLGEAIAEVVVAERDQLKVVHIGATFG